MNGASLSTPWGAPFAGLLVSIAVLPIVAPGFCHRHVGSMVAGWSAALLLPFAAVFGPGAALHALTHAALAEYLPFMLLLTALFTVAGGIHIRGNLRGTPAVNTAILALGAVLASVMGTTGASMLLIRPLLRANDDRRRNAHVVVFFIFIVGNVGGALTPLGDPPLFVGFLNGVDFFWTLRNTAVQTVLLTGALLAIFYLLDRYRWHSDGMRPFDPTPDTPRLSVDGGVNAWLLGAIVLLVLTSGSWRAPVTFDAWGTPLGLPGLLRDVGLVAVTLASLLLTPPQVRADNRFDWAPLAEVAKLFAGIFVTIAPVVAMLRAGVDGPFGALLAAVALPDGQPDPARYFWATGLLSAFLDNAPTYLVFFHAAGGDAPTLMTAQASTLAAISCGAVFMGALSYIGNAPNLMVRSIALQRGVRMPGFFGYMAWSGAVLLPLLAAITFIFFR